MKSTKGKRAPKIQAVPTRFTLEQRLLEAVSDVVLHLPFPEETIQAAILAAYASNRKMYRPDDMDAIDEALEGLAPTARPKSRFAA